MSLPEDFLWRGCASNCTEPLTEEEEQTAVCLVDMVVQSNPGFTIEFRVGTEDYDRTHHVFRWTSQPPEQIFRDGFQARNTRDESYFNLEHFVNHAGEPLYEHNEPSAFISTTADSGWRPNPLRVTDIVYRYEIYAPGGIIAVETLGATCRFPNQTEVTFVAGIAPQYIRSAQRFRRRETGRETDNRRHNLTLERVDNDLLYNTNFDPRPGTQLRILRPVRIFFPGRGQRGQPLNVVNLDFGHPRREKRQVPTNDPDYYVIPDMCWQVPTVDPDYYLIPDIGGQVPTVLDWYATLVGDTESWISAAFRSSKSPEAYVFMNNEYVLINYAPGTTDDWVVNGPLPIYEGFPSLACTVFAEWGIDCAFTSHYANEAFVFCGNLCAHIDFAPGTTDDKILKGPMTIARMFPFFKGTVFEKGIDAAFESFCQDEAYLFKGGEYALINYNGRSANLIAIRPITQGFYSLSGTIFETGIEAAFASSRTNEAYLFKGDSYALINFAPGTTDDCLIGGVKKILPNWSSFRGLLPRKNQGDDVRA